MKAMKGRYCVLNCNSSGQRLSFDIVMDGPLGRAQVTHINFFRHGLITYFHSKNEINTLP